jgi:hypothetical protein
LGSEGEGVREREECEGAALAHPLETFLEKGFKTSKNLRNCKGEKPLDECSSPLIFIAI